MESRLDQLLSNNRLLWRGRGAVRRRGRVWPSGYPALDEALPEGGWPKDALLELTVPQWGIGELQLLLPAMRESLAAGGCLVMIAPPYIPYAPALFNSAIPLERFMLLRPKRQEDVPWAMEQLLRQRRCSMVLAWPGRLKPVMVRRLQLAAEAGDTLGVLLQGRDGGASPAALRLKLLPRRQGLELHILKSRGAGRRSAVSITFP